MNRQAATAVPSPVRLRKQLLTCLAMCGVAAVLIVLSQDRPDWPGLFAGLPLPKQLAVGLAAGGLYCLAALLGHEFASRRATVRATAESYRRLDLRGWNPLWIALAAGFGEELLFRGALQPMLGIWATSLLFLLAHTRIYRFNAFDSRVLLQAASVFAISVCFGYVAQYAGLFSAMLIHAAMDIAGLYAVRRMASSQVA